MQYDSSLIINFIYYLRGQKVMLDRDLAQLYGIETKQLKRAVKRNITRFPFDFMFELTEEENISLRSQNGTLKKMKEQVTSQNNFSFRGKHSKYLPYAFTEQGVAMLSSVLNSDRAVQVNIAIMRAFVKIREIAYSNKELSEKISELEKLTNERLNKQDKKIQLIFDAIKKLMKEESKTKNTMGFQIPKK